MLVIQECPACNGSTLQLEYVHCTTAGDSFNLYLCQVCQHGVLNPMPEMNELANYYSSDYAPYEADHAMTEGDLAQAEHSHEIRHVKILPGMNLLDYGCGAGAFLRGAKKLGANVCGIEPSPLAVSRARDAGLKVYQGTIKEFHDSQECEGCGFDLITVNHVLEHVPDPVSTLEQLGKFLNDDGVLWVAVPNFGSWGSRTLGDRWHSADIPRHLHHFTMSSLSKCLQRAQLAVRMSTTRSLVTGVSDTLKRWLKYRLGIPYRISTAVSFIDGPLASRLAARMDRAEIGEALIFEAQRKVTP